MVEPSRGPDAPLERLAARPLSQPHRDRLSPSRPDYGEILAAHLAALREGANSYIDPKSGLTVLTAGYLASRGYCCDSGCSHCPYVAECEQPGLGHRVATTRMLSLAVGAGRAVTA